MLSGKTDPGYAPAAAGRCQSILYSVSGCDSVIGKKGHTGKSIGSQRCMELPRPGVTRTVKEMEEKGYLQKIASEEDGRVTYITVTKKGSELSQKYDEQYFDSLLPYMEEIPDEDAECMIQTIEKFYQIMCERRKHYDER